MIYFYTEGETPAFDLRGRQVSSYLNLIGIESECIDHTDIKDSTVIVVKWLTPAKLRKLRNNGNRVILDVLDTFCYKRYPHQIVSISFVDGVITCSEMVRDYFHPWMPKAMMVIPHHWDSRLMDHAEDTETFAIGYFGDKMNHEFKKTKNVIPIYEDFLEKAFKFKCHFSVRKQGTAQSLFKPATKVALAAGCGSNIITSRDPSVTELLGEDYPYYVDDNQKSIDTMVEKVRLDWLEDSEDWQKGLRMMEYVRKITALPVCAKGIIDYVDYLNGRERSSGERTPEVLDS